MQKKQKRRERGIKNTQKTKSKMADINTSISIMILNVNGLNNPLKLDVVRLDKKYI